MILTIGPGGSGLTFLNWSIIYLRGDNFYTTLDSKTHQVTNNPLRSTGTAHGHQKDHIAVTSELLRLKQASSQSVVYVVPTKQSDINYILSFASKKIVFNTSTDSDMLMARMCSVIPNNPYTKFIDNLSTKYNKQIIKQMLIESNKFFTNYYTIEVKSQDCIVIDYADIFKNLDQQIYKIFKYLELEILPDRMEAWSLVYQEYRSMNQDWLSKFLNKFVEVDNATKTKILKEIIQWKNG
jgi:hypothetical protein